MTAVPERWLQDQVRALCVDLGLAVQHMEDSRRAWLPGWPDLVILGTVQQYALSPVILYRELKRQHEDPTSEQRRVGYLIQAAGGDWAVWRPDDLLSGRIARELTAISKLGARSG